MTGYVTPTTWEVSRLRDEVRELRHRLDSKDGDR